MLLKALDADGRTWVVSTSSFPLTGIVLFKIHMNIYLNFYRGSLDKAIELFNKAINLSRTEDEMAHLYSLLDAAMAQARVAQFLGIQMPTMM